MHITLDKASEVRQGEQLNLETLNAYLKIQLSDFQNINTIQQYGGGYSNLTYLLKSDTKEYVLRRPPFGVAIKSAHDMEREFKVLQLLGAAAYAKKPNAILYCDNEAIIGCPFYLMERLEGVILRANTAAQLSTAGLDMLSLSKKLIDALVELHNLNIETSGLASLGKPEGYIKRQVEGWQKRYATAKTDDIPELEKIGIWLQENLPNDNQATLIHNDFKFDNAIFDADLQQVIGILDWEMCTIGSPLMDLGVALSYWTEATDDASIRFFNMTWLPSTMTRREVIDYYAAQSGRDLSNIIYYYIFGLFRNCGILQQIYARWKQGHSKDPRFGQLIYGVKGMAKMATEAIETGKL